MTSNRKYRVQVYVSALDNNIANITIKTTRNFVPEFLSQYCIRKLVFVRKRWGQSGQNVKALDLQKLVQSAVKLANLVKKNQNNNENRQWNTLFKGDMSRCKKVVWFNINRLRSVVTLICFISPDI